MLQFERDSAVEASYRRFRPWRDVAPEQWSDWRWQMENRITSVDKIRELIRLTREEETALRNALHNLRMACTPYFFTLMDTDNPHDCIRRQAIPTSAELLISPHDLIDPLDEEVDSPVRGLTHRYPDRVLLLVTDQCSMYCRYCTRRRMAGETDKALPMEEIRAAVEYIRSRPEVRDVLISGGDPFVMPTARLEQILAMVRAIPHVEIIRIGTRTPAVLPQRIDDELAGMLRKYHPLFVNVHFSHPREFTPEACAALAKLADAGIPLNNQSVLLRGVNDNPDVMKNLIHKLLMNRVRPYYLYQCDLAAGISHFRTPVSVGIQIMESLRGHTTGLGIPTYVVDAPGGGGKIPVMPNYMISQGNNKVVLRNYEGLMVSYPEPDDYTYSPERHTGQVSPMHRSKEGIISLISGGRKVLEPRELHRRPRSME